MDYSSHVAILLCNGIYKGTIMNDITEYLEIKRKTENAMKQIERAKGALESELQRWKKMYGCDTVEEAEVLLKKKKRRRRAMQIEFAKMIEQFEKKWKHKL